MKEEAARSPTSPDSRFEPRRTWTTAGEEMAERERHRGEYEYVAPERRREEKRREATLDHSYEPSPNEAPSSSGRVIADWSESPRFTRFRNRPQRKHTPRREER